MEEVILFLQIFMSAGSTEAELVNYPLGHFVSREQCEEVLQEHEREGTYTAEIFWQMWDLVHNMRENEHLTGKGPTYVEIQIWCATREEKEAADTKRRRENRDENSKE
jgi:hypothetical protein